VVFDLDGTLVLSQDLWFRVLRDTARALGAAEVARPDFDATFGQDTAADVAQFFPGHTVARVDDLYRQALPWHLDAVVTQEGAGEVLRGVRRSGRAVGCATNASVGFARAVLAHAGLAPLVDALACADEVAHGKPAPDLLHLAARRLGRPVERCVLVGDSRYDVEAGHAAGCPVVGLGVDADLRVERLVEVLAWLGVEPAPSTRA
jgi:beta-phosphoglucomutase-like phosphatase (HAD superfamily)